MTLFISKRFAPSLKPDDAMLAGLLHEVGKLYILARADKYPELFGNPSTLVDVLESWNPGVGQAILDAWNLPEAVVNAVGEQGGVDLSPYAPMTIAAVLMVATTLCNLCKADEPADPYEIMQLPTFRRLRLDVANCQILIEDSCALLKSLG
jgi:HD-like signal output (HDOD) protein